jgi:transposase-like protein
MKRTFSREFKLQVARQAASGEKGIAQLCREHGLGQTLVSKWKRQYQLLREHAFPEHNGSGTALPPPAPTAAERVVQLEAALGRAHLKIELLQQALEKGGSRPGRNGR